MKKIIKLIAPSIILLIITVIILLPEKPYTQLDETALIEFRIVGGIAGFNERITIYNDGRVDYDKFKNDEIKISNEQLKAIEYFINNKKYEVSKNWVLLLKWFEPKCCDRMYTAVLINKNGRTLVVRSNELFNIAWDIIKQAKQSQAAQT